MTVFDSHSNFAVSSIAVAPSPALSGLSLQVAAGQGALFPAAPFNCVAYPPLVQPTAANAEIVRVTGKAGDTFTIVRAQEGSSTRRSRTRSSTGTSETRRNDMRAHRDLDVGPPRSRSSAPRATAARHEGRAMTDTRRQARGGVGPLEHLAQDRWAQQPPKRTRPRGLRYPTHKVM